jgi:hypothetical protein
MYFKPSQFPGLINFFFSLAYEGVWFPAATRALGTAVATWDKITSEV